MNKDDLMIISVTPEQNGVRIDKTVAGVYPALTRNNVQKLLIDNKITVNGNEVSKNYKVKNGDVIRIIIPEPTPIEAQPEDIPLEIAFEDDDLLVVNKPKGMVVHPAAGNYTGTLVNALLYYCGDTLSGINGAIRPGIVHRIDKDTSGLLIVAKNDFAHRSLAVQIKEHSFTRIYEAVVCGRLKNDTGTIHAPIGRHPVQRKKMAVTAQNSKDAVTHYEVISRYHGFTHVRLRLETGRTHQIRVHMASIGHPVAGDAVYGNVTGAASVLQGQCLHAKYIAFIHPRNQETIAVDSELPDYFTAFLSKLRPESSGNS